MKKIKTLAVIGLLTGVGALQAPAAPATPTTWVQTLNFALTAQTTSDVSRSGKFGISSKDVLALLANDTTIVTITNLVPTTNAVPITNAASVTATPLLLSSDLLTNLAIASGVPGATTNVTLSNIVTSVTVGGVSTNVTNNVTFTFVSSNSYSFGNTVTGTNGTNTATGYIIPNAFTFSITETATNLGTNVTISFTQPAASITATYISSNASWSLAAPNVSTNVTYLIGVSNVTQITSFATNTLPAFTLNGAKLVYVKSLTSTNDPGFEIIPAGKNATPIDVNAFFAVSDVAPFEVVNGKTTSSIQQITFSGHEGTSIVLQGLFIDTKGVTVPKVGSFPDMTKSFTATLSGWGHIVDLVQRGQINADVVMGGKLTTTGAAK